MSISDVIKKAVLRLKNQNQLFTPDAYSEAFCKEAAIAGIEIKDCSHVDELAKTLSPDLEKELRKYRVANLKELSRFLIARLNAVKSPPNMGSVASALSLTLAPSLSKEQSKKLLKIINRVQNDKDFLLSKSLNQQIKEAVAIRIALDRSTLEQMVESLDGVLYQLSNNLVSMIDESDRSKDEILEIKKDLESKKKKSIDDISKAQEKLLKIAQALEKNTDKLDTSLRSQSGEVDMLKARIKELEGELEDAKEASREDFLTKLYNKRALDDFMNLFEDEYKRYSSDYTIALLDIDHFKRVNDTYGHDAGDAILVAFSKIVKKVARSADIAGRFGGEEFMLLLHQTDIDGARVLAQKINEQVKSSKFMYRGKRIEITVSVGLAQRSATTSLDATIKDADTKLYEAKESGRDMVCG